MNNLAEVFTLYSYEDAEIKTVVSTIAEAHEWIAEYRGEEREDDIRVEKWSI